MDTLIAGHRMQQDGPVSEAVVVKTDRTGDLTIEIASFDEQHNDRPQGQRDALLARSLMTIPASVVDQLVQARIAEGGDFDANEEGWTQWENKDDSNLMAASFVRDRIAAKA